jgi:hypothetical protein
MRNILAKVFKMLHIIVMDLDTRAKEKFGCAAHTIHTANEMFFGVQFKRDGERHKYRVSGTVTTDDAGALTRSKKVGWFYPTYVEKGGIGKISIPPTQVG